jgi:RNA polymerase sigma-70 factor (ECF subfamily)
MGSLAGPSREQEASTPDVGHGRRGTGSRGGLEIVDRLPLEDYRYRHATRGELLRRLGRTDEARDAYRRALALAHDEAERRLLQRRLAELGTPTGPAGQ